MNILYLTTHLNIGGITSYLLSLSSGLRQMGHKVYIGSSGGQLRPEFISKGVTTIKIPIKTKSEISPKVLLSFVLLLGFIKRNKIDIIHANTRVTQVLASLLSQYSGKPYVTTCHGFFKNRLSRRLFACWGAKTIAISLEVREHLLQDFKLAPEKISVIHNGIDVEKVKSHPSTSLRAGKSKVKSEVKEKLGLKDGPVIGIVARLSSVKGHIYLIQAMNLVLDSLPNAQLLIVGDGNLKDSLVDLTRSLKIENNVRFIPSVIDTSSVLSAMDVFVMPSLQEGLGLALMEAMAYGVAVIGSNIGGIKTLIKDNYSGLLVEPANASQIACAISRLLKNPVERESFSVNAAAFIRDNFSNSQMCSQTEGVYKECLERK